MQAFETKSLIDLLKQIEENQKEQNPYIEHVTVTFYNKRIHVKSYIGEKLVRENDIEIEVVD